MADKKNDEQVKETKTVKEPFMKRVKTKVENVTTDAGLFFKRNGKKIATAGGVIAAALVGSMVIDKLGLDIDPSKLFKSGSYGEISESTCAETCESPVEASNE